MPRADRFPSLRGTLGALTSVCVGLVASAVTGWAQGASGPPRIEVNVPYGYDNIGRLVFPSLEGLELFFGPPHWNAGPSLHALNDRYLISIEVGVRDLDYLGRDRQAMRTELVSHMRDGLLGREYEKRGTVRAVSTDRFEALILSDTTAAAAQGRIERSGRDSVRLPPSRYRGVALVLNGPAIFLVSVESGDSAVVSAAIRVVRDARAIDGVSLLAYRFTQYRAACATHLPEFAAANDGAFAASPLGRTDLLALLRQQDSTATPEMLETLLSGSRPSFVKAVGALDPTQRTKFCEGIPQWIAETLRDLPATK
ncbi:hypothetical protein EBR44_13545 [bacterium]|nr:hypothetical protein [bacterium]